MLVVKISRPRFWETCWNRYFYNFWQFHFFTQFLFLLILCHLRHYLALLALFGCTFDRDACEIAAGGRISTKYCIYRKSAPPRTRRLLRPNKWTSHKYENRHAKNKYAFYLQSLEFTNRMRCLRDVSIISTVRCSIPPPTRRSNPIQSNPIHL